MNRELLLSWLAPVLFLIIAVSIYGGARENSRLTEDDQVIWSNSAVRSQSLAETLQGAYYDSGNETHGVVRPLATSINIFRYNQFGSSRSSYIWSQLFLLVGCATALFILIRQTTGSATAGLVTGVLFVSHTALSISVLRLAGLADLLSLFLGLLATSAALVALRTPRARVFWIGSLVLLAAALGAKETAFVFAPVLWLAAWSARSAPDPKGAGRSRNGVSPLALGIGVLVVCILALGYRMVALNAVGGGEILARAISPDTGIPIGRRLVLGLDALCTYARMLIYPHPLSSYYDHLYSSTGTAHLVRAGLGALLILLSGFVAVVAALKRRTSAAVWAGLVLSVLVAMLGVVAPAGDFVNERLVGFLLAGVLGLAALGVLAAGANPILRVFAVVVPIGLSGFFGWLTMQRVADYKNQDVLIRQQIEDFPESAFSEYQLGNIFLTRNQFEAAKSRYESALGKRETLWPAWVNLGATYSQLKEYGLARRAYNKAIDGMAAATETNAEEEFAVPMAKARFNRALVLMRQDQNHLAVPDLLKTLEVFPDHLRAHATLGLIFRNSINYDEQSLYHLGRAIELERDPNQQTVLQNAIDAIRQRRETEDMRRQLRINAGQIPDPEEAAADTLP